MACADVAEFLSVPLTRIVKSIAVFSEKDDGSTTFALLLLRGDHELNEIKASKLAGISPSASPAKVKSRISRLQTRLHWAC
jgi:prolyl-tRNA synthetase